MAISIAICLGLLFASPVHVAPPSLSSDPVLPAPAAAIKETETKAYVLCVQLVKVQLISEANSAHKDGHLLLPEAPQRVVRMTSTADRLARQQDREQGLGTNAQAVKFYQQDYETLRQQCLKTGFLFKDDRFPAEPKSLGYNDLGPYSPKTKGIVWKRPTVRGQ